VDWQSACWLFDWSLIPCVNVVIDQVSPTKVLIASGEHFCKVLHQFVDFCLLALIHGNGVNS